MIRPYLKCWDKYSNKNVDLFLPNSKFVESRVHKYYGQETPTQVVYPFVDLAIEAFNDLTLPLKIIGGGSDEEVAALKAIANPNIEFLGKLSRTDVISHYARARAFIFPGVEDFGITPLEAMASGTPIIAYKAGGVLETLTEETATFFNEANTEALKKAILKNEQKDIKKLYERAELFSRESFEANIKKLVWP